MPLWFKFNAGFLSQGSASRAADTLATAISSGNLLSQFLHQGLPATSVSGTYLGPTIGTDTHELVCHRVIQHTLHVVARRMATASLCLSDNLDGMRAGERAL